MKSKNVSFSLTKQAIDKKNIMIEGLVSICITTAAKLSRELHQTTNTLNGITAFLVITKCYVNGFTLLGIVRTHIHALPLSTKIYGKSKSDHKQVWKVLL